MEKIPTNPILEKLPQHLRQFIKPQNYELYSPIDQAVWRYVMRKNVVYLSTVAHKSYIKGLEKTGVSLDNIPDMYGMNRILKEIGWAAVAVDGFIPPAAFMEFQAYNILVIASDIRQLENIEYTPAPDIIHEGAGHAPIIANPEYAEYLRRFGAIGCKAISSAKDYELYEAVRYLSIIKEAPNTSQEEIEKAEEKIAYLQENMGTPSEMALIRNLHWWTVEYGLIGSLENPKIYGAGLLSSIGESEWCMTDAVKKIPYTIEAIHQSFDITKPQPQLFVTPNFAHLSLVLEEFANSMSLRKGGLDGLLKLVNSKSLGTIEYNTGLQVSGIFTRVIEYKGNPIYIQTTGGTALAYREKELINHGTNYHAEGFGSPIGKLKGINLAIENMSPRDLSAYKISEEEQVTLIFEGGITVYGTIVTGTRNLQGKIILIRFKDCTVTYQEEILFRPEWGIYDMAVGSEIIAAFNGPADLNSFDLITHSSKTKTIKVNKTKEILTLEHLYSQIRTLREQNQKDLNTLEYIFKTISEKFTNDWLAVLEIYELCVKFQFTKLESETLAYLENIKSTRTNITKLIETGLEIIYKNNAVMEKV